jgi:hypothetical protein
VFLPEQ